MVYQIRKKQGSRHIQNIFKRSMFILVHNRVLAYAYLYAYSCTFLSVNMFESVWADISHVQVWHSSSSSLTATTSAET